MNEYLLKQAIQADLDWILNAPPLLAPNTALWRPESLKSDQKLIIPDAHLASFMTLRDRKLGGYFEELVGFLFNGHPDFSILAQNRVIYDHKTTLGELDLLVQDQKTDEIIHLELALKFYLWVPQPMSKASGWVGAGLKDFLDRKVKRLYHHQLQLPAIAKQHKCWPSNLPYPDSHQLWMPGRLYLPENQQNKPLPVSAFDQTPWSLNPLAEVSSWYEYKKNIFELPVGINKADWLVGQPSSSTSRPLPAQFIRPKHTHPIYVLPPNWQNDAQLAIQQYESKHD